MSAGVLLTDDGHIVRLGDDADPERGLTVRLPFPGEPAPAEQLPDVLDGTAGRSMRSPSRASRPS